MPPQRVLDEVTLGPLRPCVVLHEDEDPWQQEVDVLHRCTRRDSGDLAAVERCGVLGPVRRQRTGPGHSRAVQRPGDDLGRPRRALLGQGVDRVGELPPGLVEVAVVDRFEEQLDELAGTVDVGGLEEPPAT